MTHHRAVKLRLYEVTVGLGYGLTYPMHFYAEDDTHAKEQAEDALVNLDEEWVEKVEEIEDLTDTLEQVEALFEEDAA